MWLLAGSAASGAPAGGSSSVDPVAAAIAIVALAISAATLYLTALRRATVECDEVPNMSELRHAGFSTRAGNEQFPIVKHAKICLFISNSGTSSAVLDGLWVTDFSEHTFEVREPWEPLWEPLAIDHFHVTDRGDLEPTYGGRPFHIPRPVEAGDTAIAWLWLDLPSGADDVHDWARRLGNLYRVEVGIAWAYWRSRSPLWALVPRRLRPDARQREIRQTTVELDTIALRRACADVWQQEGADQLVTEVGGPFL